MTVEHPVIPTFYLMPKMLKNNTCPPGRPIVVIGSVSERACIFVYSFLQPLVLDLPTMWWCGIDFINDIVFSVEGLHGNLHGVNHTINICLAASVSDTHLDFLDLTL